MHIDFSLFCIAFGENLCMKETLALCNYKISFMVVGQPTEDDRASIAVTATKINIISRLELI